MFGFITINDADIEDAERVRYRQAYCGVCRALHARFGQLSRITLNHDLTFMALVLMSLYEPVETTGEATCPVHPLQKQPYTENSYIDYAADMTVALMYFKCLDDAADDDSLPAKAMARALKKGYARAREQYPRQCETLERGLEEIARIEAAARAAGEENPDAAANCFGVVFGELFVYEEDFWAAELRALGCELGRFVYMMDAAVDLREDEESGSYNPLAGRGFAPQDLKELLCVYAARVAQVFERLPLEQDVHLLRSVIYAGVWGQFNRTYENEREEDDDSGEACASATADDSCMQEHSKAVSA